MYEEDEEQRNEQLPEHNDTLVRKPVMLVLGIQEPEPSEELGRVEAAFVPDEEPSGDHGAEEGDEDEPGDAHDPSQDAMLALVTYGLRFKVPPW